MPDSPSKRSFLAVLVALLSLTTFAFAQSVYEAVAGNREFVVLQRISHADLWLIIVFFNLIPPLVLALVWLGMRKISQRAADLFLSAAFLLLLTPFVLELHRAYLSPLLRFSHNTVFAILPLFLAALLVFRYRSLFQRALLLLSPFVLLLPAFFLWRSWHEVAPDIDHPSREIQAFAPQTSSASHPPIFILLFDELTRPALLDANGKIDESRFPHFAQLAQHSTWFSNATANAEYTTRSLPVIFTGNFPHGNDASDAAYPNNLFRLFAPYYDVTIHEEVTRFCANSAYHCPDAEATRQRGHLVSAVFKLYLLRAAPKSVVVEMEADGLQHEQQRFHDFLSEIATSSSGARPPLQFMHLQLPHAPYMLRPDGSIHPASPAGFDPTFAGNAALVQRLRNDYEMQLQFVDRELGNFLDTLKRAGLYDKSLIVVTSDHGVSWKVEAPGRVLSAANADMIFPVPLLIKLPGQTDARISNRDVQLIDLLPTIAAVAGVQVPWPVAGRDVFAPNQMAREKVMIDASGRRFAYPNTFAETASGK